MTSDLLERDDELTELDRLLAGARGGDGAVVLVTGEAGIGKSSLVDRWIGGLDDVAVHVGWCDDLVSGRALGPLRDVARRVGGSLAATVAAGEVGGVLDGVLDLLDNPLRPSVLVLEDLHWADEATLDVMRYVGRRIQGLPALLVGSFRDEEVGPRHPLTGVLAALGRGSIRRIALRPLSRSAVATLAAPRGLDPDTIVDVTGGNPFFVTETLDADGGEVPATVVDSVLVKLYALETDTRIAVERLAVIPGRAGPALVAHLAEGDAVVFAPAERRGLVEAAPGGGVRFRHELTRRAVLESLTSVDRARAHRRVLDHLVASGVDDHSRLLHHAVGANDDVLVVSHGTAAADEAFRAGAFRAAAAAHDAVLRRASLLAPSEHARLLTQDAWALHNLQRFTAAVDRAEAAVARSRELDDQAGVARALRVLARTRYVAMDSAGSLAAAEEAVRAAALAGDPEVLAEAEVVRLGTWSLLDRVADAADAWPGLLADVRAIGRTDLESLVLNYGAVASIILQRLDRDEATTMLVDAVRIARRGRHVEAAARAYTNIVGAMLLWRRHDEAMRWLDEGLEHTADHDLAYFRFTMLAHRGTRLLDVGRWAEAESDLTTLLAGADEAGVLLNTSTRGLARIALRRGDDDATERLEEATAHAERSGATQYLAPVAVLATEAAFLADDPEAARAAADRAMALEGAGAWAHGEVLAWCRRSGADLPSGATTDGLHEEWAHVLAGRWEQAAALAAAEGRVYDRAMALLDSGEAAPMLEALAEFDRLGAAPAAGIARARLRAAGVRSVPRGPNEATRRDPAGLTPRQLEVLTLLGEGLTNPAIAERLVVSQRTVDNHVSAILRKLDVASRHDAAAAHAALVRQQPDLG